MLPNLFRSITPLFLRRCYWFLTDSKYRQIIRQQRDHQRARKAAHARALSAIWAQTDGRIASGPFAGMKYLQSWAGGPFTQELLGTYEKELWPVVEQVRRVPYQTVLVIGAGEGFYVCGLGYCLPASRIKAYETVEAYHPLIRRLATMNGLAENVEIHGTCTETVLSNQLRDSGRSLVLCDIEGAEYYLIDPEKIPELLHADILVEVHRNIPSSEGSIPCADLVKTLSNRFDETHTIQTITTQPRTLEDLPPGIQLDESTALTVMDERRGGVGWWLFMTRKEPSHYLERQTG